MRRITEKLKTTKTPSQMFFSYETRTPHAGFTRSYVEASSPKSKSFFSLSLGNCSQVSVANAKVLVGNEGHLVIRCKEGYNLIGSNTISCLPNGLLNGTLPSCSRGRLFRLSHAWLKRFNK